MNIYLFGASTTTDDYPAFTDFPAQGWGYRLKDYFDSSVKIINLSVAGWSLKALMNVSYAPFTELIQQCPESYSDASKSPWAYLLSVIKQGDYIVLGGTSVNELWRTDMGWQESVEEYKKRLTECCNILIERGAIPIVVTNATSMRVHGFVKEYENIKYDIYKELCGRIILVDILNEFYSEYEKGIYSEDDFVTKYFRSKKTLENYYKRYGYIGNRFSRYFGRNPDEYKTDEVHLCVEGALRQSSIFIHKLKECVKEIAGHIIKTELDMDECIRNDISVMAQKIKILDKK